MSCFKKLSSFIKGFLNKETLLYLIFGVLTTIVSIVSYFIVNSIFSDNRFSTTISTVLSWVFAVAFAFVTNKLFVFNSKSLNPALVLKEAVGFVSARLVSLGFELVWMILTVDVLFKYLPNLHLLELIAAMLGFTYFNFYQFIAKCIANVFVLIMNYIFSKLFIFKSTQKEDEGVTVCG